MNPPPEVSVVIPLTDARGDAAGHLRTWTHGQTLSRDRYELVLASDANDPAVDRGIADLLQPHDALRMAPNAGLIELYNAAAATATSPWLLFTENHCEAEPETLARVVEGIDAKPGLEAASLEHSHLTSAAAGELGARWFDSVYEEWFGPGAWHRLNLAGFVIHRDVFEASGGLDPRYGLFSTPLLAARLNERGAEVGHLPEARILHVHVDQIHEHHGHSADYVLGESAARTSLPPGFAERYFGHRHLLWNRAALSPPAARRTVSVLGRELRPAGRRDHKEMLRLLGELSRRLPEAIAGPRLRRRWAQIAFAWSTLGARNPLLSRSRRYRAYLRAQDRVTRLTQLRWIESDRGGDTGRLAEGSYGIEELAEGTLVGVHGLERHEGRPFRWGEPVLTIRLGQLSGCSIRIRTGNLRGRPTSYVTAAYLDGRRIPAAGLHEEGSDLVIQLHQPPASELTLLCRPLEPGSARDDRSLGIPVFGVEVGSLSATPGDRFPESVLAG